jgi:hypothetical protein
MFSISAHRRLRGQLSVYIDGELRGAAAERLEKHLAGCEGCRLELEQLRATVAALHDLPEVQAPRSFTLSRESAALAAGRRPRARAAAPLALGVRLAAAGVAVALAAVFVVDLGGLADNGDGTTAERSASDGGAEYSSPTDAAAPNAEGVPTPSKSEAPGGDVNDGGTSTQTNGVQPPAETGGGGIDALAAAEIGLGVTLGLLVLGSIGLAFAGRKT